MCHELKYKNDKLQKQVEEAQRTKAEGESLLSEEKARGKLV